MSLKESYGIEKSDGKYHLGGKSVLCVIQGGDKHEY
jgi:hypothetical protein